MLTSVKVENWKSLESAVLNIDPITVLIGTNSSGKSNVLDALSFLNRLASGALLTSALQGDGVVSQLRGGLDWAARVPGTTFAISASLKVNEAQDLDYRIACQVNQRHCEVTAEELKRSTYRLDKHGKRGQRPSVVQLFWTDQLAESSPTVTARLYNSKRGTPRQLSRATSVLFQLSGQKSLAETQEGVAEMLAALRNIFILDPIPSHMRSFSPLSDKLNPDAGNIAGVLAALSEEEKRSIERTLTAYVSKLPEQDIRRVFAEAVGKFESDAMLYCEEGFGSKIKPMLVDARGMSDGTLRFLAVLTALLTRPKESLLVVEEIDNGLHPSRSSLLLRMLREVGEKRNVDVMVTTHNPALLDAMGMEMVPFITVAHRNALSGATELTLLEDIALLPKLLAQGLVGKISSKGLIEDALTSGLGAK